MIEGWVAVTHSDWFDFLATRPQREEVNFWRPSDYHAFRGSPGAPFFFKLKAPRNAIGGFGYVASFTRLPDYTAWQFFTDANGAATFEDFRARLHDIRDRNALRGTGEGLQIGCIVLVQVSFFPRDLWIPQPTDWSPRNLTNQRYDLATGEGARIWRECLERADYLGRSKQELPSFAREALPRYGEPVLVRPRLGQGAFRVLVTDAYKRACAVTGEHSLPVLEAAHIKPYANDGPHEICNGLLLRSDVHKLFDLGYISVTPDMRVRVSDRLRADFQNGRTYYPMDKQPLVMPSDDALHPSRDFLAWHNDVVFRK